MTNCFQRILSVRYTACVAELFSSSVIRFHILSVLLTELKMEDKSASVLLSTVTSAFNSFSEFYVSRRPLESSRRANLVTPEFHWNYSFDVLDIPLRRCLMLFLP